MMNKSSQYCVALIKMKILKTKGGDVPKKFFSKPNVLGLALHQWQVNDFQITCDNNRCVRENI